MYLCYTGTNLGDGLRRGFTLLEIIVATAILGVLSGIGWSTLREHIPRFRLVRTAKQFRGDLQMMRQIAVQTNREARLRLMSNGGTCSNPSTWGGSWERSIGDKTVGSRSWDLLPEDSAEDGRDDDQTLGIVDLAGGVISRQQHICFRQWNRLNGPTFQGTTNPDSIVFGPRGWLRNPPSDFNSFGYLEFEFVNQQAARDSVRDVIKVQVSRAGMIRLIGIPQSYHSNNVGTDLDSSR